MNNAITTTFTLLITLFCCSFSASAQLKDQGTIQGSVLDAKTNQGIEFATISLFSSTDSSLVTGSITTATGKFTLTEVPKGRFYLNATFIGYDDITKSDITIDAAKAHITLEPLLLQPSATTLQEAEVAAEKNAVETHIDKRVFNVDKSVASEGGDGLEVLRNVPSVNVDQDGVISLRGNSNVTILIDGRPTAMDASTFLQSIPSSQIEKVEIITNPSAKYNPEGISGILNIVLKKNRAGGFNGSINASSGMGVTKHTRNNGSISLNYRNKRVNVYAVGSLFDGRGWYGGKSDISFYQGDTTFSMNSVDDGFWHNNTPMGRAGVDFFANEYSTFYLNGTHSRTKQGGSRNVYTDIFDTHNIYEAHTYRNTEGQQPNNFYELNTGWQKTFKQPGRTLDIDLDYQLTYAQIYDKYTTWLYDENYVSMEQAGYQNTNFEDTTWVGIARLDYVHPLNDSTILEAGWMSTLRDVVTDFHSETYNPTWGAFIADTALNNFFTYAQQTHAGYVTFGQERKKIGYKIGLRLEQTITDAELVTTGDKFDNDYLSLFPSLHVSKKFSQLKQMQFSYSRRINRPQLELLNPFPSYSDPFTRQVGNPFLKPEFIHVFELSYLQYWKKFNINSTLYYRRINDMSRRYLTVLDDQISEVSYRNLSFANIYGIEMIATYSPKKTWRINATINLSQTQIDPDEFNEEYDFNTPSASLQFMSTNQFKKGWSVQLFGSYNPRMPVLQGVILPMYGCGIGVRKSFLNRKASLGVRFTDLFNTREFTFESAGFDNYSNKLTRDWQSQILTVSFSYRFGKMLKGPQRRQSKANSSSDDFSLPDMQ